MISWVWQRWRHSAPNDVQTDHVVVNPEAPTGVALIAVGMDGENQISVAPGANASLEPSDVVAALETLRPHVLLVSLEVSERTARAALEWARDHDVTTILNPAPPQPWTNGVLGLATYVTPNEHERPMLEPIPAGVAIIETRGSRGRGHPPGRRIGGIGPRAERARLSIRPARATASTACSPPASRWGLELSAAVRDAVMAASLSVGTAGAREGMPDIQAISEARERFGS